MGGKCSLLQLCLLWEYREEIGCAGGKWVEEVKVIVIEAWMSWRSRCSLAQLLRVGILLDLVNGMGRPV